MTSPRCSERGTGLGSHRLHVALVCSFNRARSVMAAALFAEQLRERGLSDLGGRGYPVPVDHRASLVGGEHVAADLVVALGGEHVGTIAGVWRRR